MVPPAFLTNSRLPSRQAHRLVDDPVPVVTVTSRATPRLADHNHRRPTDPLFGVSVVWARAVDFAASLGQGYDAAQKYKIRPFNKQKVFRKTRKTSF